jgi:hypothetical protein
VIVCGGVATVLDVYAYPEAKPIISMAIAISIEAAVFKFTPQTPQKQ